jgi:sugar phosphate isomerase/epimerase
MNRRTFLGTVTAATVMAGRFSWAAGRKAKNIGVQLYTVRDAIKDDFDGSLTKVAAVGYKEVELAGFAQSSDGKVTYFDKSPQELRAALDRHGLSSPATHVGYKSLEPQNFPKVIEASRVLGHKYIVNPWVEEDMRKQADDWKRIADTFNRVGEETKKAGMQFAYHNHWFEYVPVDGKLPYDVLLEQCDPKLVKMELDLCWITVARQDPIKYFERYPGRFPLVHVKDVKEIPQAPVSGGQDYGDSVTGMTEVGSGLIDWKKIFAKSEQAGIEYYFVEHDRPKMPFESIKTSYAYLSRLRF